MRHYNVFTELKKNLDDFESSKVTIVAPKDPQALRFGSKIEGGYTFSQKETLETIDLMYNSKYKKGIRDSEGQRKTYMNIVSFHTEVARMQTDLDVKDFVFIPDGHADIDRVALLKKQFTVWTRENEYGQIINDLNKDYSKYGTCVAKRVGKTIERVPVTEIKNTQDAETLKEAAIKGYVIQEHELNAYELKNYPGWNIEEVKPGVGEKLKFYERYSLVPRYIIDEFNGEESDDDELVLAVQILAPDENKDGETGFILFMSEIDEEDFPYEEAHWDKQDGRWLGIGEVEKQFENQIAKNLTANLRRRAIMWGAKKIFQTQGDAVAKNLVKEVQDGAVLEVGKNGEVVQIATESRHLPEISNDSAEWDENSRQKSFTFEVSTGESMPSGTPFRLGVILSNSVQSHFGLKRENFGLFLRRAYFNQLIPIFKKQTKEHIVRLSMSDEGAKRLFKAMTIAKTNQIFKDKLLDKNLTRNLETLEFDFEAERQKISEKLMESPYFFVEVPDKFYDDAKFFLELSVTGESSNIEKEIETLVNVWQTLEQKGDPRAERLLEVIVSKTGEDLVGVLGDKPKTQPTQQKPQLQGALQGIGQTNNGQIQGTS